FGLYKFVTSNVDTPSCSNVFWKNNCDLLFRIWLYFGRRK
ncbi:MAG: hypothetical protein ACI91R_002376, partial [Vicingaceae bacterium]